MKYRVSGTMTISVSTIVEAETAAKAIREARGRMSVSLCHQCSTGHPEDEWVTSGELDGEPDNLTAAPKKG